MSKFKIIVILLLICFVGLLLREYNYKIWPREGATFDEFAWTFQGISIFQNKIPTSWSPHPAYNKKQEYFNPQGAHFVLVTPYLEHPPLFGMLSGGFALINGVRNFDEVTIQRIRPLAIIMGVISILGVYLLGNVCYGNTIGLVAAGIYAINPTVVIGSRLVQNENFFIPLWLFALSFAYTYLKQSKKNVFLLHGAALLCGILVIAKIPWIAAAVSIIVLMLYFKNQKEALYVGIITLLFLLSWMIYGFLTDTQLFMNLWKLQLARYDMAFNSFFLQFTDPLTVDRRLIDGWIYIGWLTMFWILTQNVKKHAPLIFGFLSYMLIYVAAIPGEPMHGWYRYPFFPFLTIALAVFLIKLIDKAYFAISVFISTVGLSLLSTSWEGSLGFSYPILRGFLIMIVVGALPAILPKKNIIVLSRVVNYILIIFCICLSIWTVLAYNEQ